MEQLSSTGHAAELSGLNHTGRNTAFAIHLQGEDYKKQIIFQKET